MGIKLAWLAVGAAAGVVVTLLVQAAVRTEAKTTRAESPDRTESVRVAELVQENERLQKDVARLRVEATTLKGELFRKEKELEGAERPRGGDQAETPADDLAPPTDEEIQAELEAFGQAFQQVLRGGGEEAKKRLRDFLARGGEPVLSKLVEKFQDDATGLGPRSIIAHALAQSGNPEALEVLKNALRDPDAGMLMHRLASHGLAFSDAEGLDTILSVTAHKAQDPGARANAAFGLARRGNEEGIPLYMTMVDEAIEKGDPAGLQYLGGVALLGEKAYPAIRDRLLTYEEPQALLVLIEILKARGDKGAIPNLEKIAYDSTRPVSIQKSAEAALKVLRAAK